MIVLHALWDNIASGKFHLWAESSTLPAVAPKHRGRQSKKPRPHPFALAIDPLKEAVGSLSVTGESATSAVLPILLPSARKGPLASLEIIRGESIEDTGEITLTPWDINTLTLDPGDALDFLISLPGEPSPGVAFGSSLCFWVEVAKFSLELITRQCFMPTISEGKGFFRAAWCVVINEEDSERVQLLSNSMPPSCRAFLPQEGGKAPSPSDLLSSFINRTVDAFVRRSLSSISILPPRRGRRVVSLSEQWLQALSSDDPRLEASTEEAGSFLQEIEPWLSQIQPTSSDTPFRTCFRLDSPGDDAQSWEVSFHLQASDDRSLLVPAKKVWGARSGVITFLKRRFENPQERLLADLGRASRVFPAIDESLKRACPVGVSLVTEQAYSFLRQSAPLLEQSGFGVLLPPWWQKPSARLSAKLRLKPKAEAKVGSGLMGLDSIVAYDWKVALGDETLSAAEFEKLASLKVPLVKVRGQWVELRPEEIEAAIAFFQKRHDDGEMGLGEALRIGLGQEVSEVGLPVMGLEAAGWVGECLDRFSEGAKIAEVEPPQSFNGQMRPYQIKGLSWLVFLKQFGFGACLADDMGLGKTIEFIAFMLHERVGRRKESWPGPTLLICPMSVVGNWKKEVERFGPLLQVMVHHGADRLSGKEFEKAIKKHDLVISTYALAHRDEELFSKIHWECVVLDEAQNIKNPSAKQTQAIRKLTASHRVTLTGTPVENRLSELWSIMDFLNPGYLKSAQDFHRKFVIPIEKYRNHSRAEMLKRLIQPFVLRRIKTDPTIIKDLPEKMEMKVFCNLSQEQATLYEAVVKEMLEKIEDSEGIERKGLVLSTLLRLKQVCNHPAHFLQDGSKMPGRSGKLIRLEEMLEELLAEGDKALIFTQFAEMGTMLRNHLRQTFGCETLFLYGGTTKKQRDAMIQRFQDDHKGPPLFILSLKAGGLGINLTAANHVFHFDRWWNPAVENQATDRAFRIGQKKNVQVHKFVCLGTLEERIDEMIERKKELAESIVGTGEAWLTEMSTEQLKEIFALSREAVREE
ncbi:MAG: DEAD/DEAH box helicase [Dehalococcoidia bacterium]|nr:RNA polymerase-associated protein RapA [Chloroflexota bacterium]MBT9159639.1 RNA polymerase-associated protein RapA [Chloroflexota bacterium]MBT9161974.1 RNA polymerase-associated protein RapA [Chloroflexota bacterium]